MGTRAAMHRPAWRRRLLVWPLCAAAAAAQDPGQAPAPLPPADLRAGTLVQLASHLSPERPRPQRADAPRPPYRIGLLGQDDVTAAAQRLLPGRAVGDAKTAVVVVESLTAIEGRAAEACDLLYVAGSIDDKVLARVVAVHAERPMPIVCERPGFAAAGGSVQLFADGADLRFEVNAAALKKQGIKASLHLRKLSRPGPTR
ncbi:MAG: YfiR family protein [Planctomycetes bacterium]|nr:YfiR family protein [Planctomycetota bacterium]